MSKVTITRDNTPLIGFPLTLNGVPLTQTYNLTNWVAYFIITPDSNPSSNSTAVTGFPIRQVIASNPSDSTVSFQLTNSQTKNLDPTKTYYYDFSLKDPTGAFIFTVVTGQVQIGTNYNRSFS